MRSAMPLPVLTLGGLVLAACGGDSQTMDQAQNADMDVAAGDSPACYIAQGTLEEAQQRPSPLMQTPFTVGDTEALLCYGAPSARGREIVGGLLVYGQPERIGANEPTTLHLAGSATVGGVALDAGSYSLYAIPHADEWEFFLNSNWQRWGIPIDAAVRTSDVGSFTATPETMDEFVERLQYRFANGEILLEWENTRLRIPVSGA
jgi:hypothetical protein